MGSVEGRFNWTHFFKIFNHANLLVINEPWYRTKFLSSVLLYMQGAICPPKSRNNIRTIVVQHGQVLHKSLCDRRFWIYWFLARHEAAGERLYCPCNIEKFGSVFPLSLLLFLCVNIDVLHVLFVSQGTNPK